MSKRSFIKKHFTMLLYAACITLFSACARDRAETHEGEAGHEEHGEHDTHDDGILELSQAQIEAVGIELQPLAQKNLTAVVRSSGQLAVPPQNAAQVNVLTGGIIRAIHVMEGQKVGKGQVLATIENQDLLKLQQEYLSIKGGFGYVESEYNRQQQLKAAGAGTGKAQELAEANYRAEQSKLSALEQQLKQYGISPGRVARGKLTDRFPVTAPIKGTVGKISAETGSYAQPGVSLMDIVDNSKIHADLIVFEKDLSKIKVGQKVDFQLTNQGDQQIAGEIYGINKSFENDSKGVVVHAVIRRPGDNLIPGMYVTGLIGVGTALTDAVPIDAVVRSGGSSYIFIAENEVDKTEKTVHFEKVEVRTGVTELGYVQITPLEKLSPGAKIVAKGAFYLQSKSSGPAEHSH